MTDTGRQRNEPEAVAVFDDAGSLYAAIDELMMNGFDRQDISLLAEEETVEAKLHDRLWRAERLEDDPDAPRAPYISEESIGAAEGALLSAPFYVAAVATAAALVTPAGSIAIAILGSTAAGAVGAAVGAALARRVGRHHARDLQEKLVHGGLLLWVRTPDEAAQDRAVGILSRHSGRDVHVHPWTVPE